MPRERIVRAATVSSPASGPLTANAQFATTGEDSLRLNVVNANPGATVELSARYVLSSDATVHALGQTFRPTSDGLQSTLLIPLPACTLLNLAVVATGAVVSPGQCFVRVEVVRGTTGAVSVVGVLMAGYVGSWGGLGWPGMPLINPWDGAGYVHVEAVSGTVGSSPRITLPIASRWRILAAFAVLVTSGVAGVRRIYFRLVHTNTLVWQSPSSLTQPAGQAVGHSWGAGQSWLADPGGLQGSGGIPADAVITTQGTPNGFVELLVVGMDAADTWQGLSVLVEEWRNPIQTAF